jgi:hypothetical protein
MSLMMKRYIVICRMNINNSKKFWNCFEHYTNKKNRLCCDYEYWSTNILNSNWIQFFDELNSIFDEICLFSSDNEILMFFYVNDIVFAFTASWKKDVENLICRLKDIFDKINFRHAKSRFIELFSRRAKFAKIWHDLIDTELLYE